MATIKALDVSKRRGKGSKGKVAHEGRKKREQRCKQRERGER